MFLTNAWYVFGWTHDLKDNGLLGRTILGEPVVVWRGSEGQLLAA